MTGTCAPAAPPGLLARACRIRGAVPLPPACDGARLMRHVLAELQAGGCPARMDGDVLLVEGPSEGRGSVLAFVDGGRLWLGRGAAGPALRYEFFTRGGLRLCAVLSAVCGSLAWFTLGDRDLTLFGLLAPVLWLYGANHVLLAIRVPGFLHRVCRAVPGLPTAHRPE